MTSIPEPVRYPPLTRTDFVRYAGASGDFNPLHHDVEFARAAGLTDVMGHGMLSAGLLASAVTRWFGAERLRGFSVRFVRPVWPGDVLVARCQRRDEQRSEGDDLSFDLDIFLERGSDDVVIAGRAIIGREPKGNG